MFKSYLKRHLATAGDSYTPRLYRQDMSHWSPLSSSKQSLFLLPPVILKTKSVSIVPCHTQNKVYFYCPISCSEQSLFLLRPSSSKQNLFLTLSSSKQSLFLPTLSFSKQSLLLLTLSSSKLSLFLLTLSCLFQLTLSSSRLSLFLLTQSSSKQSLFLLTLSSSAKASGSHSNGKDDGDNDDDGCQFVERFKHLWESNAGGAYWADSLSK